MQYFLERKLINIIQRNLKKLPGTVGAVLGQFKDVLLETFGSQSSSSYKLEVVNKNISRKFEKAQTPQEVIEVGNTELVKATKSDNKVKTILPIINKVEERVASDPGLLLIGIYYLLQNLSSKQNFVEYIKTLEQKNIPANFIQQLVDYADKYEKLVLEKDKEIDKKLEYTKTLEHFEAWYAGLTVGRYRLVPTSSKRECIKKMVPLFAKYAHSKEGTPQYKEVFCCIKKYKDLQHELTRWMEYEQEYINRLLKELSKLTDQADIESKKNIVEKSGLTPKIKASWLKLYDILLILKNKAELTEPVAITSEPDKLLEEFREINERREAQIASLLNNVNKLQEDEKFEQASEILISDSVSDLIPQVEDVLRKGVKNGRNISNVINIIKAIDTQRGMKFSKDSLPVLIKQIELSLPEKDPIFSYRLRNIQENFEKVYFKQKNEKLHFIDIKLKACKNLMEKVEFLNQISENPEFKWVLGTIVNLKSQLVRDNPDLLQEAFNKMSWDAKRLALERFVTDIQPAVQYGDSTKLSEYWKVLNEELKMMKGQENEPVMVSREAVSSLFDSELTLLEDINLDNLFSNPKEETPKEASTAAVENKNNKIADQIFGKEGKSIEEEIFENIETTGQDAEQIKQVKKEKPAKAAEQPIFTDAASLARALLALEGKRPQGFIKTQEELHPLPEDNPFQKLRKLLHYLFAVNPENPADRLKSLTERVTLSTKEKQIELKRLQLKPELREVLGIKEEHIAYYAVYVLYADKSDEVRIKKYEELKNEEKYKSSFKITNTIIDKVIAYLKNKSANQQQNAAGQGEEIPVEESIAEKTGEQKSSGQQPSGEVVKAPEKSAMEKKKEELEARLKNMEELLERAEDDGQLKKIKEAVAQTRTQVNFLEKNIELYKNTPSAKGKEAIITGQESKIKGIENLLNQVDKKLKETPLTIKKEQPETVPTVIQNPEINNLLEGLGSAIPKNQPENISEKEDWTKELEQKKSSSTLTQVEKDKLSGVTKKYEETYMKLKEKQLDEKQQKRKEALAKELEEENDRNYNQFIAAVANNRSEEQKNKNREAMEKIQDLGRERLKQKGKIQPNTADAAVLEILKFLAAESVDPLTVPVCAEEDIQAFKAANLNEARDLLNELNSKVFKLVLTQGLIPQVKDQLAKLASRKVLSPESLKLVSEIVKRIKEKRDREKEERKKQLLEAMPELSDSLVRGFKFIVAYLLRGSIAPEKVFEVLNQQFLQYLTGAQISSLKDGARDIKRDLISLNEFIDPDSKKKNSELAKYFAEEDVSSVKDLVDKVRGPEVDEGTKDIKIARQDKAKALDSQKQSSKIRKERQDALDKEAKEQAENPFGWNKKKTIEEPEEQQQSERKVKKTEVIKPSVKKFAEEKPKKNIDKNKSYQELVKTMKKEVRKEADRTLNDTVKWLKRNAKTSEELKKFFAPIAKAKLFPKHDRYKNQLKTIFVDINAKVLVFKPGITPGQIKEIMRDDSPPELITILRQSLLQAKKEILGICASTHNFYYKTYLLQDAYYQAFYQELLNNFKNELK